MLRREASRSPEACQTFSLSVLASSAALRNAGLHGGTESLRIELAAHGEHGIADGFDLEAAVAHESVRRFHRLPSVAGEDEVVQFLQRPIRIVHEPVREPVEQLGICWSRAHEPEIVRGGDEALAEVLLPDPVHDHARRERIAGLAIHRARPRRRCVVASLGGGNGGCC